MTPLSGLKAKGQPQETPSLPRGHALQSVLLKAVCRRPASVEAGRSSLGAYNTEKYRTFFIADL